MKFIGAIGIPIEMIKSLYFNKIYKHIKKRLLFLLLICPILLPAQKISTDRINWASFLSQHDLVWNAIKPDYYSGAIMGNGLLGVNIYADKEDKSYHWDIGRSDVTENRGGVNTLYDQARLPIGYFKLIPEGEVLSENMRLSLWDAVTQGRIETDKGDISFRTYVDANREVIVIDTDGNFKWSWVPGQAVSSRTTFAYTRGGTPEQYLNNPNPQVELLSDGAFDYSIQRLFSGWVYVTAWHRYTLGDVRRTLVTVSYKRNVDEAISEAKAIINDYKAKRAEAVENEHKQWWHNYYPASYATFSNTMMESFYWIQQYKLACLTRQDKNIIDLMGPWTDKTPWPAIWWNLNVQLTYSPLFTANRLELSKPLWDAFDKRLQSLIDNVPVEDWRKDAAYIGRSSSYDLVSPARVKLVESNQYEVGNLTWVLYYYWQYCTYKADDSELLNKFYPLLKRSIAYYDHILYKGEDGKLHLPVTASPEYKPAPDCNYDLSLLRWGLTTLLDVNKQYKLKDALQSHWESVIADLADYPVDAEQGYTIGQGVKLESSHRHFSHLLMIYPLYLVNWDQPENKDVILRSLNHWIGMKGALQGYSYTGSSSIYSMMGDGQMAVKQLSELLKRYIQPNTLYKESGPVVETPLSAAASLQELYLQYWNGKIRVFPAVPSDWKDASFIDFRTHGGFLVSALRKDGKTAVIQLESTEGGTCKVQTNMDISNALVTPVRGKAKYKAPDTQGGLVEISMRKGDIIQIKDKALTDMPSFEMPHPQSEWNHYGVRR